MLANNRVCHAQQANHNKTYLDTQVSIVCCVTQETVCAVPYVLCRQQACLASLHDKDLIECYETLQTILLTEKPSE